MSVEDLITTLNTSDLLPYEIATAVAAHLTPMIVSYIEYSGIEHLNNNNDLVAFYLAAKRLGD